MSQDLSSELLTQLFAPTSNDPLLTLVTLSHASFSQTIRLVNNTEDITSRGDTFLKFPMRITLAPDDGETAREVTIEFDNVSLYLIQELRSVTSPIDLKLEVVLASIPDSVQISMEELKLRQIFYDKKKISGKIYMDDFMNTALTSEKYTPLLYPGLFG